MSQHHILITEGVLATLVPLARGWRVIRRLRHRGLHPIYRVQGEQLLILFGKKREIGADVLPSSPPPSTVDKSGLMKDWIVGRIR